MKQEPTITVGIVDGQTELTGRLDGNFRCERSGLVSGRFSAKADTGTIVLRDGLDRELLRSPLIKLAAVGNSTFRLSNVTIGKRFHWQRTEEQTFQGDLVLRLRENGTIIAINEIPLETYLESVVSSEMSGGAPVEFLKAHAMLSRSWLLAALHRGKEAGDSSGPPSKLSERRGEVIRWYEREDHDLFDVCADDHCQRYQGITKIVSEQAGKAVLDTRGQVITCQGEICDARYSKACGGLTEDFGTAWGDKSIPYLTSIPDAPIPHQPIATEEEARRWILSAPDAYCNTQNKRLLETILPEVDRETRNFFRWRTEYPQAELEEILREKSGFDFGTLKEIVPLRRGPSGRISRLNIVGSKRSVIVGKELEIRRWLSRSHLYSSAFVVTFEAGRVVFQGAGWGHGVGLCQIGAAVMATRGFSADEILRHYFRGTEIQKIY